MAAITSFTELTELKVPGLRCFQMDADDADTFTPSNIQAVAAFATYDADPGTGNPIGCTVSSGVVTINCTGLSSTSINLFVIGKD